MSVRVALLGCGHWGSKLARCLSGSAGAQLVGAADPDPGRRAALATRWTGLEVTANANRWLEDRTVDAVVVATPLDSHAPLVREALAAGKHVYVEKLVGRSSADVEDLIGREGGRVVMVGHTGLHAPAARTLRRLVADDDLGALRYLRAVRSNLGTVQPDVDVVWDLAPHDLSLILQLLGRSVLRVTARAGAEVDGRAAAASLSLDFGGGLIAHVFVTWLGGEKERRLTVAGDRRRVVYDELDADAPLRIHDRPVEDGVTGGVAVPTPDPVEPLQALVDHFVACCAHGRPPITGLTEGLAVVRILEACDRSLAADGAPAEVVAAPTFSGAAAG